MYMRKNNTHGLILAAAALMVLAAACNTRVYDEEKYRTIIKYVSPVDSVDQRHEWQLSTNQTFRMAADNGKNAVAVMILTANPLTDEGAAVMNKTFIGKGETADLAVSVPMTQERLYAALVDEDDTYYVTPFSTSRRIVSFVNATSGKPVGKLAPQTYSYMFEENFPEPGDYDYNDLVLRLATERTGDRTMTVSVTIAAVGGDLQMAGGIRLVGYKYGDIDSIRIATGKSFNENVPQGSLYLFDKQDLLVEGRNGEAILNLFADAHWAMDPSLEVDYGRIRRNKYNVTNSTNEKNLQCTPRSVSYVVYFKSSETLNKFTLDTLDPFIITAYSGGRWETHLDEWRAAQVLYEYPASTVKDLPWALRVPTADFYYPLEGAEIGFKKDGAMFGAYMTASHSFGEWAENCLNCLDWYEHQYATSIYVWNKP